MIGTCAASTQDDRREGQQERKAAGHPRASRYGLPEAGEHEFHIHGLTGTTLCHAASLVSIVQTAGDVF